MLVKCTKSTTDQIGVSHQECDDRDGTKAGFYAWVGPPDDQSDFALGPFVSRAAAHEGALKKLRAMGYTVRTSHQRSAAKSRKGRRSRSS